MKILSLLMAAAIVFLFFWGNSKSKEASRFRGNYNQNEYIINYLINNNKVKINDLKEAKKDFEFTNGQTDASTANESISY